jgi:hypothetical protein
MTGPVQTLRVGRGRRRAGGPIGGSGYGTKRVAARPSRDIQARRPPEPRLAAGPRNPPMPLRTSPPPSVSPTNPTPASFQTRLHYLREHGAPEVDLVAETSVVYQALAEGRDGPVAPPTRCPGGDMAPTVLHRRRAHLDRAGWRPLTEVLRGDPCSVGGCDSSGIVQHRSPFSCRPGLENGASSILGYHMSFLRLVDSNRPRWSAEVCLAPPP